ncbi:hypothetical protein F3C99_13530 [Vitellibacter sp. q18]|nr:hypothetical protein [Aequorivita lutea]
MSTEEKQKKFIDKIISENNTKEIKKTKDYLEWEVSTTPTYLNERLEKFNGLLKYFNLRLNPTD